ncbi:MAG: DNA-3-methyladenine glycosylase 2 family protein [Acidimicrobiaceae bacterium]|nr:DNA-3-methyladenine glycosylase 2 family protein [Acidimicrobiaceae bacterium]
MSSAPGVDVLSCPARRPWSGHTARVQFGPMQVEAVATTGIYCRAECSARPLARNTARYPSSVAAEAAGYRPCLRCRPERRAGSLTGLDVPEPVAAALLRITDGYLDDHDEQALAAHVGYSARHLRRLFELHIGATPSAIARSRRAHFARRLIDETDLPFDTIARAAGLGGPRQLHRAMTSIFGFTPSQLRSKRRRGQRPGIDGGLVLSVPYMAPFDFGAFLAHHARRAIPGVESTNGTYVRSISVCGHGGIAEVDDAADGEHLRLRLHLPTYDSIIDDVHRARALLGTDADPDRPAVLNDDPVIGPLMQAAPGLRVPRAWDRFETVIRIVAGQQVSVAAASTLCGRVAQRFGTPLNAVNETAAGTARHRASRPPHQTSLGTGLTHLFPSAAALADAGARGLEGLGFTQSRIYTIIGIARAVSCGELELEATGSLDDTMTQLCEFEGIGPWSAHLIAMRVFGHDDAFPASDLGLRRAVEHLTGQPCSTRELQARAESWRPYRSWAAQHLWHAAAVSTDVSTRKRGNP